MTLPPHSQPGPDGAGAPGWDYSLSSQTWPGAAESPRRPRRGIAVATVVAGVVVLGGAGYAAASYLSGGGRQPEDVLPADTLGFVKVDLDPATGQKVAAMSLLDKFPDVTSDADGDLREQLLEPLLDLAGTDLHYSTDVEPWLGDRMAVAVIPAEDTQAGVAPVVALAVTDEDRMHDSLAQGLQGTDFGFAVRDDFVLITDSQDRADHIAGAERTLADDKNFAGDRAALAGDQVALAWADFSALTSLLPEEAGAALPGGMIAGPDFGGRFILGVHAQADALEMVGLGFSASDLGQPSTEPTRLIQDLPDDTVAALGASQMGDRAVALWEELDKSGALDQAGDPLTQLGLDFPDDLRSVLGTDLVVAAFGDLDDPSFGARVFTDDPQGAFDALHGILTAPESRGVLDAWVLADGGYALATDDETTSVLSADGGLGETDAFRAAVADPDHASVIGYADLAAVIDQLVAQGGDTAEEARKYSAVEALGYSVNEKGDRFTLRITTR